MLYAQIKKLVLSLLEQYTAGGVPVEPGFNGQADDLCRIPAFLNAALVNIYTRTTPVTEVAPLNEGREMGSILLCRLPDNCWRLKTGGVFRVKDGKMEKADDFRLMGRNMILVPTHRGEYWAEYCPYPELLPDPVADDYFVDEPAPVLNAAAFYCAAMLVLNRDSHGYAALMNEFDSCLAAIPGGIRAETGTVTDVLGGAG